MLMKICLFAGVALAVIGILILIFTNNTPSHGRSSGASAQPTRAPARRAKPPRRSDAGAAPRAGAVRTAGEGGQAAPQRPMPPRRSAAPRRGAPTHTPSGAALGPHGLWPVRFPYCPICRSRNIVGQRQMIFWNPDSGTYQCKNGHTFAQNGGFIA